MAFTFNPRAPFLRGLRYPGVTAIGRDVLIVGGTTVNGPSRDILVFHPDSGSVRTIGRLRRAVAHAITFTLGGLVYVAGGRTASDEPMRSVESIDPSSGSVRRVASLPAPLADAAAVVVGQRAWIFGGWRGHPVTDVLIASLTGGS
jgi:N-acetylneuraminic acid mutarotase